MFEDPGSEVGEEIVFSDGSGEGSKFFEVSIFFAVVSGCGRGGSGGLTVSSSSEELIDSSKPSIPWENDKTLEVRRALFSFFVSEHEIDCGTSEIPDDGKVILGPVIDCETPTTRLHSGTG